jgi:hypothetical protein
MLQCLSQRSISRGTASACVTANKHQALLSGCPVGKILGRVVEMRGDDWENVVQQQYKLLEAAE